MVGKRGNRWDPLEFFGKKKPLKKVRASQRNRTTKGRKKSIREGGKRIGKTRRKGIFFDVVAPFWILPGEAKTKGGGGKKKSLRDRSERREMERRREIRIQHPRKKKKTYSIRHVKGESKNTTRFGKEDICAKKGSREALRVQAGEGGTRALLGLEGG